MNTKIIDFVNHLIIYPKKQTISVKKIPSSKSLKKFKPLKNSFQIKNGRQLNIAKSESVQYSYIFDCIFNQPSSLAKWVIGNLEDVQKWQIIVNSSRVSQIVDISLSVGKQLINKSIGMIMYLVPLRQSEQMVTKNINYISQLKEIILGMKENSQYSIVFSFNNKKITIRQVQHGNQVKRMIKKVKDSGIMLVTTIDQPEKNNLIQILKALDLGSQLKKSINQISSNKVSKSSSYCQNRQQVPENIKQPIRKNKEIQSLSSDSQSSDSTLTKRVDDPITSSKTEAENLHLRWKIRQMEGQYRKQSEKYIKKMKDKIEGLKRQNQELAVQNIKLSREKQQIQSENEQIRQNYERLLLERDQYRKQTHLIIKQHQNRKISELQAHIIALNHQLNSMQQSYKQQIDCLLLKNEKQMQKLNRKYDEIQKDYMIQIDGLAEKNQMLTQQCYLYKQKNKLFEKQLKDKEKKSKEFRYESLYSKRRLNL